jgi:glutaredoxin
LSIRTLLVLAVIGFIGWRYFHVDPAEARTAAGLGPDDVAVFTVPECGAICRDQIRQFGTRGVRLVEFDINTEPGRSLWKSLGSPNQFPSYLVGQQLVLAPSLRSALAEVHGSKGLMPLENHYFQPHFGAGQPRAVMYSAQWCGACRSLREELQRGGTPFVEIDVERHASQQQLAEVMQIGGYPTVYVGYARLEGSPAQLAAQIRDRVMP